MKEKSQFEKNAADKQVELLSGALSGAVSAGGHWLNATGKGYPKFYPAGVAVSPFNALFMALHSDKHGCKSNLFTLYSEAKVRGESVKGLTHFTIILIINKILIKNILMVSYLYHLRLFSSIILCSASICIIAPS